MIKIYHNPKCSKSRQTLELLRNNDIQPQIIYYLEDGLKVEEVNNILNLLNLAPRDIIRKNEVEYKEHNLSDKILSDAYLIETIAAIPKLLQRPIVINVDKAIIGRPPENVLKILNVHNHEKINYIEFPSKDI